jgi:FkbM family methyltransferase
MNLRRSFSTFLQLSREDRQLSRLGPLPGSLLSLHYSGRLRDRLGTKHKLKKFRFRHFDTTVDLILSFPYSGAFKGVFLDKEYDCSNELKHPVLRILDLGSNIGMGAISLNCQFPGVKILCLEPDPRNLPLLTENLEANSIDASIVPAAIGPATGVLNLRFGKDPTCSALESSPMHHLGDQTIVEVTTIPTVLANAGWDYVDLVKMDIEGTEEELLSLNNEWLSQVGSIILEIHPNTTPERIASYLEPFGFHLRRTGHGREPVFLACREPEILQ